MTDAITVYADYVCPFCHLGRRSLERYRERRDEPLAVDWRPFDLRRHERRPDGTVDHDADDGKDEAYFDRVRENVARLRKQYGTDEMRGIDDVPDGVDSFDAQAASLHVRDMHPERWEAFDGALYDALWRDGRDVGDTSVIADVAEGVGLDGDAVRDAVADDALRDRLRTAFDDAAREGVAGVPTFVYGDHEAVGAVPPEQLRRLVEGA